MRWHLVLFWFTSLVIDFQELINTACRGWSQHSKLLCAPRTSSFIHSFIHALTHLQAQRKQKELKQQKQNKEVSRLVTIERLRHEHNRCDSGWVCRYQVSNDCVLFCCIFEFHNIRTVTLAQYASWDQQHFLAAQWAQCGCQWHHWQLVKLGVQSVQESAHETRVRSLGTGRQWHDSRLHH